MLNSGHAQRGPMCALQACNMMTRKSDKVSGWVLRVALVFAATLATACSGSTDTKTDDHNVAGSKVTGGDKNVPTKTSANGAGDTGNDKKSGDQKSGKPEQTNGTTPPGGATKDPNVGKACGGNDRIACPDGYSCLSAVQELGSTDKPMGTCIKDDGPPPDSNIET